MWILAPKARLPRIAADHLGPLVPRRGTTASQEEREELVRPVAPAQADEGAHRPDLVWRVVLPRGAAVPPGDEFTPVPLIRREDQVGRETVKLAGWRDRDGRRRGVEIAELRGAGKVRDRVGGGGMTKRCSEIDAKFLALHLEPARGIAVAQRSRDRDGAVIALQRPKVIPV